MSINHAPALYRFRDKARYWSEKGYFSHLLPFNLHHPETIKISCQNLTQTVQVPKLLDGAIILTKSGPYVYSTPTSEERQTDGPCHNLNVM